MPCDMDFWLRCLSWVCVTSDAAPATSPAEEELPSDLAVPQPSLVPGKAVFPDSTASSVDRVQKVMSTSQVLNSRFAP